MKRDEIAAWVERHRDELPTTLADLSRFPIPFRVVIANSVDAHRRTGFWTEHLQSFVGPESSLSVDQQTFISATIDELPNLMSAPAPNPTMAEWEGRASQLFMRRDASMIFGTLGPPEPPEGLPLPPDALTLA